MDRAPMQGSSDAVRSWPRHAGARPAAVIADPHPLVRRGLTAALERHGIAVVEAVGNAKAALDAVTARGPCACVLSARLPGDGLGAVARIAHAAPKTAVVVLTPDPHPAELLRAVRGGALGYVPLDTAPERVARAVLAAIDGEAAIPRGQVVHLTDAIRARYQARGVARGFPAAGVTAREETVLDLLAQRFSTAQIAEQLGVAPVTVRRHVSALMRKLHAADRDALVVLVGGAAGDDEGQPFGHVRS